jgi:Fe-S cluster assembly protein SufD
MTPVSAMASLEKDAYVAAFQSYESKLSDKLPVWLRDLRRQAARRFSDLNFPTVRDEAWRYTDLKPLLGNRFFFDFGSGREKADLARLEPFLFGRPEWNRLVFVNGFCVPSLSRVDGLGERVFAGNLAEAFLRDSLPAAGNVARHAAFEANIFSALNTAFLNEGAFVWLGEGQELSEPLHLVFASLSEGQTRFSQPRTFLALGEGARAKIIESYVSLSEDACFTNAVTEIVLGAGALLEHYKLQRENAGSFHIGTTQVSLARESAFNSFSLVTGARLGRNHLNVLFDGEGASTALDGLYMVSGEQQADNYTVIDHRKPRGASRQLYKGIIGGRAKGVFSGKIFVREDAQKTDAHQTNKNLLLSERATADTKPQLEIAADDVKCTHGAAVGQLDEQALFYLRSRGMDARTAGILLTYGFANEVVERIGIEPVRNHVEAYVLSNVARESWKGD